MKVIKILLIAIASIFIFIVLMALILAGYIWVKNPLGLKDIVLDNVGQTEETKIEPGETEVYDNPLLDEKTEQTLQKLGIDPATLPTEITPELEDCLINAVGEERADEIRGGDMPTAIDAFKARNCL